MNIFAQQQPSRAPRQWTAKDRQASSRRGRAWTELPAKKGSKAAALHRAHQARWSLGPAPGVRGLCEATITRSPAASAAASSFWSQASCSRVMPPFQLLIWGSAADLGCESQYSWHLEGARLPAGWSETSGTSRQAGHPPCTQLGSSSCCCMAVRPAQPHCLPHPASPTPARTCASRAIAELFSNPLCRLSSFVSSATRRQPPGRASL